MAATGDGGPVAVTAGAAADGNLGPVAVAVTAGADDQAATDEAYGADQEGGPGTA